MTTCCAPGAHLRILRPPAARQGGAGGRGLATVVQQPRPAEPVAEPGGQRHHPGPRLQRAAAPPPVAPHEPQLPPGASFALGAVGGLRLLRSYVVFHLMRWFPTWAGWLPRHEPVITRPKPIQPQSPRAMQPAALPELHQRRERRHGWRSLPQRPWWPWLTRGAAAAFFVLVAGLLFRQARTVDWPAVLQALRALPRHPRRGWCAGAGQPPPVWHV